MSEAVCRGWQILSADISKAFLQGVTYKELAELTGTQPREINFYLPAADIPLHCQHQVATKAGTLEPRLQRGQISLFIFNNSWQLRFFC